eukprot:m.412107 g.412107  ORF g.412107 m.412107 type:complete len:350 (+) comp56563_c0_seq7:226-1275(+)
MSVWIQMLAPTAYPGAVVGCGGRRVPHNPESDRLWHGLLLVHDIFPQRNRLPIRRLRFAPPRPAYECLPTLRLESSHHGFTAGGQFFCSCREIFHVELLHSRPSVRAACPSIIFVLEIFCFDCRVYLVSARGLPTNYSVAVFRMDFSTEPITAVELSESSIQWKLMQNIALEGVKDGLGSMAVFANQADNSIVLAFPVVTSTNSSAMYLYGFDSTSQEFRLVHEEQNAFLLQTSFFIAIGDQLFLLGSEIADLCQSFTSGAFLPLGSESEARASIAAGPEVQHEHSRAFQPPKHNYFDSAAHHLRLHAQFEVLLVGGRAEQVCTSSVLGCRGVDHPRVVFDALHCCGAH